MANQIESLALGRLLGWTALLATLAVTPWTSYDPINVPKLAVIAIGGFIALGALIANAGEFFSSRYRHLHIFALAFSIDLLIVLLVSGTNPAQEFFGTFGRATGFVAYIGLTALLVSAAISASTLILKRFVWVLLIAGGLSVGYGLVQAAGGDPIKWVNQYSPVIGFLGNPNFQSSFVALTAVMAFAISLSKSIRSLLRAVAVGYALAALFVISQTKSQQGFLVFAGGAAVLALIWISKSKFKVMTIPSVISSFVVFVFVTLGTLNSGPLAGVLYKESVTYRGDYWRAGWNMATQNPLFGVGLDSYGDWYRRARTIEATLRRGPEITSNAAHNVLIDFASNGGFPLVTIYLFMMILVVISSIKLIKRTNSFDPIVTGLIAVWVAYQAQSIISLNQLGLAVWGWIISGLIIGYEINTRTGEVREKNISKKGKSASVIASTKVAPNTLVGMFIGLLVGSLVGLPPLIASSKFKSALESGDAQIVEKAAYIWPLDPIRMGQVAALLQQNKLEAQGLKVVTQAVEKFPDEFGLWAVLAGMPGATQTQQDKAARQMKRLDPHNPNLK